MTAGESTSDDRDPPSRRVTSAVVVVVVAVVLMFVGLPALRHRGIFERVVPATTVPAIPSKVHIRGGTYGGWPASGSDRARVNAPGLSGGVVLAVGNLLTLRAANDWVVAQGVVTHTGARTQVQVFDPDDLLLGSFEELLTEKGSRGRTTFRILDATGRLVSAADPVHFLGTSFSFTREGRTIAAVTRPPVLILEDGWDGESFDGALVDPRVLALLTAYKHFVDNARRPRDYR